MCIRDSYRTEHPEVDILLIQPTRDDLTMFRYDIMRYSARKALAHHGRASALETLREKKASLAKTLARHGVRFREGARKKAPGHDASGHHSRSAQTLSRALDILENDLADAG